MVSKYFYLFLVRFVLGWLFLYAGVTKILNSQWSAAEYLEHAKTFSKMYHWFAQPGIIDVVNVINEWGLFLLGISLILGVFIQVSAPLGVILMLLYYFPVLDFPYVGKISFIMDEHIVYAVVLLLLAALHAGHYWGISGWYKRTSFSNRYPFLKQWL